MADGTETTTTTTDTTAAPPWYGADLSADYVGVLQNRGIADKSPAEAIRNLVDGYKNAEAKIGFPHEQVRRYDPTNAEVSKAFWKSIGVPDAPEGYDFSAVKNADGSDVGEDFASVVRATAHRNNVPAAAAVEIAKDLLKFANDSDTGDAAETAAKVQAERQALVDNWGQKAEGNMFIARQAAAKLGIAPEAVSALEKAAGYKATMEMFLTLGIQMGEDKFVSNQNPNAPGIFSKEGAQARLNELLADRAWGDKLNSGDASATREFRALTEIIAGVSGQYKAA